MIVRGAILGIAVTAAALTLVAAPGIAGRSTDRHWCHQLPRWTVYYAGRAVGVHRANYASIDCFKRRPDNGNHATGSITYIYGNCKVTGDDEGCEPPLQIQSSPLCTDRPAVYGEGGQPDRWGHRRGVPSAWWRDDQRLELYTRTTTITIYAVKRSLIRKAARRVHVTPSYNLPRHDHARKRFRRESHPRRRYGPLPAPTRHALRTKKDCS